MSKLIPCKQCGHQISRAAEVCTNCSHPHEKDRKDLSNLRWALVAVGALVLIWILKETGLLNQLLDLIPEVKP